MSSWLLPAAASPGSADLFVMRSDGTGNQPLTRTELWDSALTGARDGRTR